MYFNKFSKVTVSEKEEIMLTKQKATQDDADAKKMLDIYKKEMLSPDNTPETLSSIYQSSNFIIEKHPSCVDDAFAIYKEGLKSEKNDGRSLETLYLYGLSSAINHKPDLAKDSELLDLIEKRIQAGQDSDRSLGFCYMLLAEISEHNPTASERCIEIFNKALKSPNNDSWAIPRAYLSLKRVLLVRPDLVDKIVSCADNIPSNVVKSDDPYREFHRTEIVGSCGQLFETIIKTKPSLIKPTFDMMKEELKYIARFGSGSEFSVLRTINGHLDANPKSTKDFAIVLNEMLNHDLKDGKDPFLYGNFSDAVLKLRPQHMSIVLDGLFNGVKHAEPNIVAPGEKYLKTINELIKKNPNLSKNVLENLVPVLRVRRMDEREVQAIEDIFVTIAQKKPKFINTHIAPLLNAMYSQLGYRFSEDKLKTLKSCQTSCNSVDVLDEKVSEIKKRLAASNKVRSEKLIMGKTGNKEKAKGTAEETAKIHIQAVKAVKAKYQNN